MTQSFHCGHRRVGQGVCFSQTPEGARHLARRLETNGDLWEVAEGLCPCVIKLPQHQRFVKASEPLCRECQAANQSCPRPKLDCSPEIPRPPGRAERCQYPVAPLILSFFEEPSEIHSLHEKPEGFALALQQDE